MLKPHSGYLAGFQNGVVVFFKGFGFRFLKLMFARNVCNLPPFRVVIFFTKILLDLLGNCLNFLLYNEIKVLII